MSEVFQSPMQVDVSLDSSPRTRSKAIAERILFDMDEYRDDIYDYLLEAEVGTVILIFPFPNRKIVKP